LRRSICRSPPSSRSRGGQLTRCGATSYAVGLVGVLVLRELGVLLTAEIGLMKMGEEIDALRVM
jgi:phospholipid/cholesterol/gamma-HCH transport system permease protein